MDSNDNGPPPRKRFMNGNGEGQGRFSESRDTSDFRGGRGGRGFRGRSGFRGSRGFRGGFRGRPSFSSPEWESSGFRGGRGSFRGRGSSPGFRGRGVSPGFRGRGASPFRGRGRGSFGRGRGSSFSGRGDFQDSSNALHTLTVYNLPLSKYYSEQREVVRELLAEYSPSRVDIITPKGDEPFCKAVCTLNDDKAVSDACEDFNGRFVEDCQILVVGAGRNSPQNKAVAITNLPDSVELKDLVEVLHDCKGISQLASPNTKASSPYIIVFVATEDDVKRVMDKSLTDIKGSKIVTKVLDQSIVARTTDEVSLDRWEQILGTDYAYYVNKAPGFSDVYFESANDLNDALEKAAKAKQEKNEKVDLQRRVVHGCFFAEVCDVTGDVNDVELYSLMRKHGEVTEFKRLDKDHYLIKQELSAAMAAMSLSDSKTCGGVLKLTWHNTREPKKARVAKPDKEKTKKKKDKKAEGPTKNGNENKEAAAEETDDHMNTSHEDEEMAEDDDEEEDNEIADEEDDESGDAEEGESGDAEEGESGDAEEGESGDEDDEDGDEDDEDGDEDDEDGDEDDEDGDEDDEDGESEDEDVGNVVEKEPVDNSEEEEDTSEEESEEEVVTKSNLKKGSVRVSKQLIAPRNQKRGGRPQKRKISSSNNY